MSSFKESVEETSKSISCLENDNRIITSERECNFQYNGSLILGKFDNIAPNQVCCQLK